MSDIVRAILLGIVQGLTEFLPVSSSGHSEIAKYFSGDHSMAEDSLLMTVVLHAATALSTIVVFRKDIIRIFAGLFQFQWNEETKFALKIIISMIPAALVGLFFEDAIEQLFGGRVFMVACMLLITGLLLFIADRARRTDQPVTNQSAFWIGIAQAIAITPGISRSGATISTAMLLGIDREQAARFSFLMVVPLILGKMAKDIMEGDLSSTHISPGVLLAGFSAAFISGLFACVWMIRLVKNSKMRYFGIYCIIAGLAVMAYVYFNA
ncbi:MAG: undecaprenyl-diphosphate phosphatase [Saprospiraceae bacterium]|nr:undecaprenyl-diphosphate phosphatase [Saprospiraceae bacterium]